MIDDLIVEVPLDDMELGHDADGLPKTVPVRREASKDDRVQALERERDERAAEAEQATRRATEAERLAAERAHDNVRLGAGLTNAHLTSVVAGIENMKAQAENAERDYARAMEAGDYNLAAKAQRLMAQAEAQISQREREKGEVERWLADRRAESAANPEPVREERKDPPKTEDIIAAMPKRSREWLGEHMEYVTDKKLNAKLQAAAYEAEHAEGLKPHTQEFLEFLEDRLGISSGEPEVTQQKAEPEEKPKPKVVAAAPVSRNGGSYSSGNTATTRVKLPARLVQVAKEIGTDPAVYAAGVLKAIKEGKLPKNYLDADYPHGA